MTREEAVAYISGLTPEERMRLCTFLDLLESAKPKESET